MGGGGGGWNRGTKGKDKTKCGGGGVGGWRRGPGVGGGVWGIKHKRKV